MRQMIHRKRKEYEENGLHGIMCSKLIVLLVTMFGAQNLSSY